MKKKRCYIILALLSGILIAGTYIPFEEQVFVSSNTLRKKRVRRVMGVKVYQYEYDTPVSVYLSDANVRCNKVRETWLYSGSRQWRVYGLSMTRITGIYGGIYMDYASLVKAVQMMPLDDDQEIHILNKGLELVREHKSTKLQAMACQLVDNAGKK